jgi:predicted negative regulator of RcsB-dependent stress response
MEENQINEVQPVEKSNKGLIILIFAVILAIVLAILFMNYQKDKITESQAPLNEAITGAVQAIDNVNNAMSSEDRQDLIDAMNKLLKAQADLVAQQNKTIIPSSGGSGHSGSGGY